MTFFTKVASESFLTLSYNREVKAFWRLAPEYFFLLITVLLANESNKVLKLFGIAFIDKFQDLV